MFSAIKYSVALLSIAFAGIVFSQNSPFAGTFMSEDGTIGIELKQQGSEVDGGLVNATTGAMFYVTAQANGSSINGNYFNNMMHYQFSGNATEGGLSLSSDGVSYNFYRVDTQQHLATPQPAPNGQQPRTSAGTNDVTGVIAGSQIVLLNSSVISNNSYIRYETFCPDGRFFSSSDGTVSIPDTAWIANNSSTTGRWRVVPDQGGYSIQISYSDGDQGSYYVTQQQLMQGRWRRGNTKYSLLRGKARCG